MVDWLGALLLRWHISVSNKTIRRSLAPTDLDRYVAMHSMTEATTAQDDPVINGYLDAPLGKTSMSKTDILLVVFGMLLPLVTQIGHAHAHAH